MTKALTLYVIRFDLRVQDNPALQWALSQGSVLPVYIFDDNFPLGSASAWWLEQALRSFNESLGGKISFYQGPTQEIIASLIKEHKIKTVVWNRVYEPQRIACDKQIKSYIKESLGLDCKSFNASLLWEPWTILKKDLSPYKVFSPFYYKGAQNAPQPRSQIDVSEVDPEKLVFDKKSQPLEQVSMAPDHSWTEKLQDSWQVSESRAHSAMQSFFDKGLSGYKKLRNNPADLEHTSRLSPFIRFGLLSPHQLWHRVLELRSKIEEGDCDHFLSELGWREFSYYLLYHFPKIISENFQSKFDNFPWQEDQDLIKLWQKGLTGYPIVDAGMRELYQTGYMHNRVRMITASFLVKNLLQHWHHGRDWFEDCLVDADLASNNASWQWVAGCGADAAPYFRIFNPILQGEKFDPQGLYTTKWLPELASMPKKYIHRPWEAPQDVLVKAKIVLGEHYPHPIVDLGTTRDKALELYNIHVKTKKD